MTKEEKSLFIDSLTEKIDANNIFYLSDISGIDAETTTKLRRLCHKRGVKLQVVKNTLLKRALEQSGKEVDTLYDTLAGNTSIMFSEVGNAPAKIIEEFRKTGERPILKGAYIEESIYIGDDQVKMLASLKSKEELLGDIILLLQSPAKNVISSLQSGKNTIAGLVKALGEREN